jgi:hypothetical protein
MSLFIAMNLFSSLERQEIEVGWEYGVEEGIWT